MSRPRRNFTAEQKAEIVRRHVAGKEPVSKLAEEFELLPTQSTPGSTRCSRKPLGHLSGRRATAASKRQGGPHRAPGSQTGPEERSHLRADGGQRPRKKTQWGALKGSWVPHDTRDPWSTTSATGPSGPNCQPRRCLRWLELGTSKFHPWQAALRPGQRAQRPVPRDVWLAEWEKQAIRDFRPAFRWRAIGGLTFMMLDDDVVAVSPASVYRVLKQAGRLDRKWQKPSKKGTGFVQPLAAARALAYRHLLSQPGGHVLLSVFACSTATAADRALGDPRNHDRTSTWRRSSSGR